MKPAKYLLRGIVLLGAIMVGLGALLGAALLVYLDRKEAADAYAVTG